MLNLKLSHSVFDLGKAKYEYSLAQDKTQTLATNFNLGSKKYNLEVQQEQRTIKLDFDAKKVDLKYFKPNLNFNTKFDDQKVKNLGLGLHYKFASSYTWDFRYKWEKKSQSLINKMKFPLEKSNITLETTASVWGQLSLENQIEYKDDKTGIKLSTDFQEKPGSPINLGLELNRELFEFRGLKFNANLGINNSSKKQFRSKFGATYSLVPKSTQKIKFKDLQYLAFTWKQKVNKRASFSVHAETNRKFELVKPALTVNVSF